MGLTSGGNVTRCFILHTERHAHLIRFLNRVQAENPRGVSRVIRAALELYLERQEVERRQESVTVQEVENACRRAIERVLKGRVVEVGPGDSELSTESPETETARRLQEMREALEDWE